MRSACGPFRRLTVAHDTGQIRLARPPRGRFSRDMRLLLVLAVLVVGSSESRGAATDIVLRAGDARLTAPMRCVDGALQQAEKTTLAQSGTAVFVVTIPETGEYLIDAEVSAPSSDANSFYLNFDTPPEDPTMIWDIRKTYDFDQRPVTWRGKGGVDDDEFDPKFFTLTAGEHRLIIAGREPARLRSLTIRRYFKPAPGTLAFIEEQLARQQTTLAHELFRLDDTPAGEAAAAKLYALARQNREKLRQAALDLAAAHPGSADGVAALDWALRNGGELPEPSGARVLALLRTHYLAHPQIGPSLAYLAHYRVYAPESAAIRELFAAVLEKNPNREVRAQAALGRANYAKDDFDAAEARQEPEATVAGTKAVEMMEALRRDFGDVRALRYADTGETIGDEVARQLVELRTLRVGMPAPEIADEDLNGARFRLSDYRGKVVLLVFWGTWCGPCMAAVPHERDLVEKFNGRPFAIVGVNSDPNRDRARRAVAQERMTWRSFWNAADSHISKAWNVKGWPTAYLIDHRGVIRQRMFVQDDRIEKAVAAAERDAAPTVEAPR